jgi:hypothetical protein
MPIPAGADVVTPGAYAASSSRALARGRLKAEGLMVDTCTIQRRTGQTVDHLTAAVTPTYTLKYSGKAKVQTAGAGAMGRRYDVGQVAEVMVRLELHLPIVGSETIARGDLVTITASVLDAALVGRVMRVHDLSHKSFATARRFLLEEVT